LALRKRCLSINSTQSYKESFVFARKKGKKMPINPKRAKKNEKRDKRPK
jgi:hypothetical protein